MKIELNQEEVSALLQILDVALKHAGLGALNAVAHFKNKIDAQANIAASAAPEAKTGDTHGG